MGQPIPKDLKTTPPGDLSKPVECEICEDENPILCEKCLEDMIVDEKEKAYDEGFRDGAASRENA